MKAILGHVWKGLQVGSVTLLALLLIFLLYLIFSGTVTSEGFDRALALGLHQGHHEGGINPT